MKILGIVGSSRRLGNTEILVKEALMGAEEEGAAVEIVRWTDFKILPCDGLATCLFGKKECIHKDEDDHDYLVQMIYGADGVVLGAPCYILEAAAVVKQFIDRLFVLTSTPSKAKGKPAAIIMPYATRGWTPYALVQPNIVLSQLGMKVIDRALVHIQGMSESVTNQAALDRARGIGRAVARAARTGDTTYLGDPGICPVCHDRVLHIMKDNETVECGVCGIAGKLTLQDGKIRVDFPRDQLDWSRFTQEMFYLHHSFEIEPSKEYFQKLLPEIREKREKYRNYLKFQAAPVRAQDGGR